MSRRKLPEAKVLFAMLQAGETRSDLARKYGTDAGTVSEALEKAGLVVPKKQTEQELLDAAILLYKAGLPLSDIERRTGVYPEQLNSYRVNQGVPALRMPRITNEVRARIADFISRGWSDQAIADHCGVSKNTVKRQRTGTR